MAISQQRASEIAEAYTAAWNTGKPEAVASFFTAHGNIVINRGDPWQHRMGVEAMAAGFFADVPDLKLTCDAVRAAGDHVVYLWTFTGHHSGTGNPLNVTGWEEWDMDGEGKVKASRGWFDAEEYARQTDG